MKSNIVAIGKDLAWESGKIIRMYKKVTGIDINCKSVGISFISPNNLSGKNEKEMEKFFNVFKNAILNDESFDIYCFETIDDFNKFDIYGILHENSIVIDHIDSDVFGMDINELYGCCLKSKNTFNSGDSTVVLIDELNNKEFVIDKFEPRRYELKDIVKTIEFSIRPVEKISIKKEQRSIAELVKFKLGEINKKVNWLADEMGIPNSSLYGKLERDSFTAYDLAKLINILNINLSDLPN
jgi:hypothetical protein